MSVQTAKEIPEVQDCAVCLQRCNYPTQLPCGHVFCFLCVKGVAIKNKKCAMCRAVIPPDYLDHPVLLEQVVPDPVQTPSEYQWYYEGRNGWWKYDERSNMELEAAYVAGDRQCKLLLAGALYIIDFQSMLQVQSRDPTRRRHVKRDTPTLPAKGIAGIKLISESPREATKSESDNSPVTASQGEITVIDDDDDDVEVVEESEDDDVEVVEESEDDDIEIVEEAASPHSSIGDVVQHMSSIDLRGQDESGDNLADHTYCG